MLTTSVYCRLLTSLQESITNLCSEARQTAAFVSPHPGRSTSCTSVQVMAKYQHSLPSQ
uniref:Uncharacterized protein n=1 Tax=Arundo donax TaxID=35708 RepID=A0A0A9GYI1_ARUDO